MLGKRAEIPNVQNLQERPVQPGEREGLLNDTVAT
jgi:hypothetical protein